jgi:hypothetical protein
VRLESLREYNWTVLDVMVACARKAKFDAVKKVERYELNVALNGEFSSLDR